MTRHERPIPRVNPSGKTVWVARWTDRAGKRRSAGTFKLRRQAQDAIDAAYERDAQAPRRPDTVGGYAATWTTRHPRSRRTNDTNDHRISRVLDVALEGVPLRHWPLADLRRRHALDLVGVLLSDQGRAATGAQNIVRSLSAMAEDAITDEVCDANPFRGVKVRANDPRVVKPSRKPRVWTWAQMRALAAAAALPKGETDEEREANAVGNAWRRVYAEAMLRMLTDCGLRLGELLPLERRDRQPGLLLVRRTAHEGAVMEGTKTDHHGDQEGRVAPVPPSVEALLDAIPARIDTPLLFPTPTGRLWRERNFYRDVWAPARTVSGVNATPHECRHSWITHLRAAGVHDAELADMAGHTVETMLGRYTHPTRDSYEQVRGIVG